MRPNYDASIDFLRRFAPAGPWVLTAIQVDRKGIETRTFGPDDEAAARAWLEDQGSTRNVYFMVNPPLRPLSKKAEREDVRELAWLHVDLDPRAGEDIDAERRRILAKLQDPPGDVPPPTAVVFSGGGYQGFWRLAQPLPIGGDLDAAEEAKRYNLAVELAFGADACHNVDRIMRLPGTLNRPNERKKKKGQEIALAAVVEFHEDRVYSLDRFQKAPKLQTPDEPAFAGPVGMVEPPGNVARLGSVDDLPEAVPDWCRVLIVQGFDPEDEGKHKSRSEALFAVCCELVRRGVPDDVIYSVITDPGFGISESVLEKGRAMDRYALRQIQRAHEENVDPTLRVLNEEFAVVENWGGECCVIEEQRDPSLDRPRLVSQSFANFKKRYDNRRVQIGENDDGTPRFAPVGTWWLWHEMRRQYKMIVFHPGKEADKCYNLWRGFAVDPVPNEEKCRRYLEHLRYVICRGNETNYRYLISYIARMVQRPDEPGYAAIVMRGREGAGKGVFATNIGKLFGRHFLHVSNPRHVTGNFNFHLWDCVVLFADEAFSTRDKQADSALKTLITENTLTIEKKGKDTIIAPSFLHVFMASNEDWVVPAGPDARRFFVLDVGDDHREDFAYFRAINEDLASGGHEGLLYYLLHFDVTGFDARQVPTTSELKRQKEWSRTSYEAWWHAKLADGRLRDEDEDGRWAPTAPAQDLLYDLAIYTRFSGERGKINATLLGQFLAKACPPGFPRKTRGPEPIETHRLDGSSVIVSRPVLYQFPPLEDCRRHWDETHGGPYEWPAVEEAPEAPAEPAAF